jgi:hypothetical protein
VSKWGVSPEQQFEERHFFEYIADWYVPSRLKRSGTSFILNDLIVDELSAD